MRRALPILAILALLAAFWIAPARSAGDAADPWIRGARIALGPFRGAAAGVLRLRAGFARADGHGEESIRMQEIALDLDPWSTDAAILLASEIAFDLPGAGATNIPIADCARLGIAALERARRLGNRDVVLLDVEVQLLIERVAPRGAAAPNERRNAVDRAIELSEINSAQNPVGRLRASPLLDERAFSRYANGEFESAASDFRRAAEHETVLAGLGVPGANGRAVRFGRCARLCDLDGGVAGALNERDMLLQKIGESDPKDPILRLAKPR